MYEAKVCCSSLVINVICTHLLIKMIASVRSQAYIYVYKMVTTYCINFWQMYM